MIFPVLCSCLITAWLVCCSADDKYKPSGSGVARPSPDSETRSPGVEAGGPGARPEVLVISDAGDAAEGVGVRHAKIGQSGAFGSGSCAMCDFYNWQFYYS